MELSNLQIPLAYSLRKFRHSLLFTILLIVITGLEYSAAGLYGFSTPNGLFDSHFDREATKLITVTLGPLLHHGWTHLFTNLPGLLVTAAYIEWQFGRRVLLVLFGVLGWVPAILLVALNGQAIGASGIAVGLAGTVSIAAIWLSGQAGSISRSFGHLVISAFFIRSTVWPKFKKLSGMGTITDGGTFIHHSSLALGILCGTILILIIMDPKNRLDPRPSRCTPSE